jgi:uncharacterized protein with NAD-binding domain and iron-sulfur cluster
MPAQDQKQDAGQAVTRKKAVIIGGGLAGMTVAKELLQHGIEVVILEAAGRLGGKAGADASKQGIYEEHGYHIFPGWYVNTRQLLEELEITDDLVDIPSFHILKKGDWSKGKAPTFSTFYPTSSPWHLIQNIRALGRLLSLPEAILGFYGMLDLSSESFDNRAALDRVSANGFFRSRSYATEGLATFHSDSILQATSVPTYQISAMTLRKATNFWFAEDLSQWEWIPSLSSDMQQWASLLLSSLQKGWLLERQDEGGYFQRRLVPRRYKLQPLLPFPESPESRLPHKVYSVLNGSLQEKFIEPFKTHLRKLAGQDPVRLNCCVKELVVEDNRVATVIYADSAAKRHRIAGNIFVLATPPEVTVKLLGRELYEAEQRNPEVSRRRRRLSDVTHLETAPMAALHLYLRNPIPGMPGEHVNLFDSRHGLSFIDVSQHWKDCAAIEPYKAVLSIIASDFRPLAVLLRDRVQAGTKEEDIEPDIKREMAQALIKELREYIPIDDANIINEGRYTIKPNFDSPLFLNTVGSWHFRPGTRTQIDNLYTAGDYCRTEVDLTTMESAVSSGLSTARDILRDLGIRSKVKILPLRTIPTNTLRFLKYYLFPSIIALSFGKRVWDQFSKMRGASQ